MAFLVVEIGNTALKAAFTDGSSIGRTFRYQGESPIEYIVSIAEKEKPEILTLASVSEIMRDDREKLSLCCEKLIVIDSTDKNFHKKYGLPAYISADRAAAIVAAREMFKGKSCTIFDFGTVISIDFMDSDGHYGGGNVSPGCRTRFKALNRYSKSLPLLTTPDDCPRLGLTLNDSICSGVISGIVFEIEAYISAYPENINVFTGGDAVYFAKRTKKSIFAVCNLVLMGLAVISERYVTKKG